jgi:membrane protein involved in colicin uptake
VNVDSLTSLLTGGISAMAVMAIFLTLILTGNLHTSAEFDRVDGALEQEKQAHAETRKALAEAAQRADAAVRASELIANAMTSAPGRPHVP